jgi:hypothetical protein
MGCSGLNPISTTGSRASSTEAAADPYERALQLLELFAWMRASNIRPATVETLLAIAVGANTPSEIRERTSHTAGTIADTAIPGLSHNGTWVALKTLLGQGQGRRNGRNLLPRCEPLAGRRPDPHRREGAYRYGLTEEGTVLLEKLVGVKLP